MANTKPYLISEEFKYVPFVNILLSYSEGFLNNIDKELSDSVKTKLLGKLLEELSFFAEIVLQQELDKYIQCGDNDFDGFVERINTSLAYDYPVLDEILKRKVNNFSKHLSKILHRFQKDRKSITTAFGISTKAYNLKIVDIDVSLGDGHNGQGTSLVYLSDGTKLIYKPRNISITNSYNSFINWVNHKLKTDLKTFKVLDCGAYGWLEFVHYEEMTSKEDLEEYYFKAGVLLAVALLLGSKDCHHENLIVSGKNPVMIDHETIIQPFFNDKSFRSWDDQFKIPPFSVLESVLIVNKDTGAPLDIVGYGVKGSVEVTELEKTIINPNTIDSKRTTRFRTRKIVDKNIPVFDGEYIFISDYKEYFMDGFSSAYNMFVNSKEELLSDNSPLHLFKNNEVRYVWRPTFVYFKILKYMRSASFMVSSEAYYSKLFDLLSKAFKGENVEKHKFILNYELKQMLNGDIPIFSLHSLDNFLEGEGSLKIFEHNCMENINHRIDLFSPEHKKEQLEYISKWAIM
jgi:type 2 lantibiotic biosynthesis protein LanM